jgi:hypothetical protein
MLDSLLPYSVFIGVGRRPGTATLSWSAAVPSLLPSAVFVTFVYSVVAFCLLFSSVQLS